MGVIKIEGKSVTLDDSIIDAGIPAIKAALSVDFPDVENADIEIIGSKAPGVTRSATVVKRGTGKGVDLSLTGSRSVAPSRNKSVEEHVRQGAQEVCRELFSRYELTNTAGVTVDLLRTQCSCGSSEPHPDNHFIVLIGGPFHSPEAALDALADVEKQREQVLSHNARLHRVSGDDITGAES